MLLIKSYQELLVIEKRRNTHRQIRKESRSMKFVREQKCNMYSICIAESSIRANLLAQQMWMMMEESTSITYGSFILRKANKCFDFLLSEHGAQSYLDLIWFRVVLYDFLLRVYVSYIYIYFIFPFRFRSEMTMNPLWKPIYLYERWWNRNVLFNDMTFIFHREDII